MLLCLGLANKFPRLLDRRGAVLGSSYSGMIEKCAYAIMSSMANEFSLVWLHRSHLSVENGTGYFPGLRRSHLTHAIIYELRAHLGGKSSILSLSRLRVPALPTKHLMQKL
jgi:hypothetical protein